MSDLMKPRALTEAYICYYEDKTIFYQFTGLDGKPADPVIIHDLLATVANGIAEAINKSVRVENVTTTEQPYLLPEGAPA